MRPKPTYIPYVGTNIQSVQKQRHIQPVDQLIRVLTVHREKERSGGAARTIGVFLGFQAALFNCPEMEKGQ